MDKTGRLKILFLALIALFLTAVGLEFYYFRLLEKPFNISRLEKELGEECQDSNHWLDQVAGPVKEAVENGNIWNCLTSDGPITERSLVVYGKDSLLFWNENSLAFPTTFKKEFRDGALVKLKNAWCVLVVKKEAPLVLISPVVIKYEYPYRNEILPDHFAPPFNWVPNGAQISSNGPQGQVLKDAQGEKICHLVVPQQEYDGLRNLIVILYFITLACFLVVLDWGLQWLDKKRGWKKVSWILVGGIVGLLVVFCHLFHWPRVFYDLKLFDPQFYGSSEILSSLGDFFFFSFWWFYLILLFYKHRRGKDSWIKLHTPFSLFLIYLVQGVVFVILHRGFIDLLTNCSFEWRFQFLSRLNWASFVGYVILGLLFFPLFFLMDKQGQSHFPKVGRKQVIRDRFLAILLLWIISIWMDMAPPWWAWVMFLGVGILIDQIRQKVRPGYAFSWGFILVVVFSFYVLLTIRQVLEEKERSQEELLVMNVASDMLTERDRIAEMYLSTISEKVGRDRGLAQFLFEDDVDEELLENYFSLNYFSGYFSRYESQIVLCWPRAGLLLEESGETENCYQYFENLLRKQGQSLGDGHFYFLNNQNGRMSYFGVFKFIMPEDTTQEMSMFVDLESRLTFHGRGYPQLLLEKGQRTNPYFQAYSFARYVEGELVTFRGNYEYPLSDRWLASGDSSLYRVSYEGGKHLVYENAPGEKIVLSYNEHKNRTFFSGFSYAILFFALMALVCFLLSRREIPFLRPAISFRSRIQGASIVLLLLVFVLLGGGSFYLNIHQNRKKQQELFTDKTRSVMLELEKELEKVDELTPEFVDYLGFRLQDLSNIFFIDINLFDLNGLLMTSSRPALFEKGIVGSYMYPGASRKILSGAQSGVVLDEHIGQLEYLSAYQILYNSQNEPLAILNLPYFISHEDFKRETTDFVVIMLNAYMFLVLVALILAIFIGSQITKPLTLLQLRMGQIRYGHANEKIDYKGHDEIAKLVAEYNRMVEELAESANLLARSERESAWREMARQIAHEIKNPLTPMKLSIQQLKRAKTMGGERFDTYFERASSTLIEQIDNLSRIATEFSNFAKMPVAKREPVEIITKLRNARTLFANGGDVTIELNTHGVDQVFVYADDKQMVQVFNNLMKNAIQAILPGNAVCIKLGVRLLGDRVEISVEDNGMGIPEDIQDKLFQPNFTTKSSGMGLGLAIVKNIITNSGGDIWFETKKGEGTTFFVQLPIIHDVGDFVKTSGL